MKNPEVPVFLLSKASGSVGLNLTVATHIMLLESDWNSLTEDQAISRAHRLGCTGPITVVRYICQSAHPVRAYPACIARCGLYDFIAAIVGGRAAMVWAELHAHARRAVSCIARVSVIAASSSIVID